MKKHIIRLFSVVILIFVLFYSCKPKKDYTLVENYWFEDIDNNTSYIVKIDSLSDDYAEGRVYLIDNNQSMSAIPMRLEMFKRKCLVTISDSHRYVLRMKKHSDKIEGKYSGSGVKKNRFVIYPYVQDDFITIETNRYKEEIFEVERLSNIVYANVVGYWTSVPDDTINIGNIVKLGLFNSLKKRDLELNLDIYLPKNDTLKKRPLMMFIHGGAFFIGDKATEPYQKWCTHFASLGYVCVSINYRMGFRVSSKAIERTAYQSTQDAHAAMRYLLSEKKKYGIDPDLLFVGGASAGSITAMNMTYMTNKDRPASSYSSLFYDDLGDIETSGNDIKEDFKIKAVANMWGTVYDLNIFKNHNTPIISFHGDVDEILPYRFGYPFRAIGEFKKVFFDEMYGSQYIYEKAKELGIRTKLHTFYGQGHALHLDENRKLNENFYIIQDEIVDFFYDELVSHPVKIVQDKLDNQLFIIDTTDVVVADWYVVGGVNLEESKGKVRAVWFEDDLHHELRVKGYYKNGAGFEDVFLIKHNE